MIDKIPEDEWDWQRGEEVIDLEHLAQLLQALKEKNQEIEFNI